MPDNPTVPGEPTAPVADQTPATPAAGEVTPVQPTAPVTPSQTPVDAEAERLRQEFAAQQARLQSDINRLKSISQSRESQIRKEAERREAELRDELNKTRMASMDDETRKAYEQEMATVRIQDLEQQLRDTQMEFENYRVNQNAIEHFKRLGVPDSVLIRDGTTDDLLQSGWDWVSQEMMKRNQPSTPAPAAPVPPTAPVLPTPPKVDLPGGTTTSTRPSWPDMIKKYGSREDVYALFQQGRIPESQMPLD